MTDEHLFDLALHASPADRAALLDRECAGNPELRQRVEALLAADAMPNLTIDLPIEHTGSFTEPSGTAGAIIAGKYKLIELIGEGGMGEVWLAEQTEPVKRRVAVKLIKAGMDSKQVIARFEAERQALAVMDHPNIAKVLDGGLHGEPGRVNAGSPFFVMELVKGVPITQYCDSKKLTPKERLELFVPVCQAIQHAHQKGIIHRDIKPSNVLIAPYDDKPVPKVIDFGLAKATGVSLIEASQATNFGGVVGTPQYMSPEQASLNNLDIDTRSDIYSLGVLLYELLTGSPPFAKKELEKAGVLEILRVIRDEEPPRPSTKLSTADALPSISASRGTEPKKLTGLLRNELDWIVMKALEKDRSRRYDTANGFAADINRYLSGEPVLAHPPSPGYRLRKFIRRNKGLLVAASLVFVALTAGLVATLWQSHLRNIALGDAIAAAEREAVEKTNAERAKAEAQTKEAEANAVIKFFEDKVFSAGRPKGQDGGLGYEVTLRDAITASLPALKSSFKNQPLIEARLRHTLGTTFWFLGDRQRAEEQQVRALEIYTKQFGPGHPDTVPAMSNLAITYLNINQPDKAMPLIEQSLAIQKRVLPPDHPDTLLSMNDLAFAYEALNRPVESLKLHQEVLAAQMRVLPPDHPHIISSLGNLANSYVTLGRYEEALAYFDKSYAARMRVFGPDHPMTLEGACGVAGGLFALNRRAEALQLLEKTIPVMKRVMPLEHPSVLMAMSNYSRCLLDSNRPDEARKLSEEVMQIQKRHLPPDHPQILQNLHGLAACYSALHRYSEALALYKEAWEARKRVLPPNHPETLKSMWGVAHSLIMLDRSEEALPLIDDCIAKAVGQFVDPTMIPDLIRLRLQHFRKVKDATQCRMTARMWTTRYSNSANDLFTGATFWAIVSDVQSKSTAGDPARLASEDAKTAMGYLQKAVAAGYKDVEHMKKDTSLEPLRERDDFQKLIAELETKAAKQ